MKVNAMGYYSLNGKSVLSFPENSRWESIINFIRNVKRNNPNKAIIVNCINRYNPLSAGERKLDLS
jgi:hypothetical protein